VESVSWYEDGKCRAGVKSELQTFELPGPVNELTPDDQHPSDELLLPEDSKSPKPTSGSKPFPKVDPTADNDNVDWHES